MERERGRESGERLEREWRERINSVFDYSAIEESATGRGRERVESTESGEREREREWRETGERVERENQFCVRLFRDRGIRDRER